MEISVDDLRALGDNGATIIDVAKHQGHREIRGAIRYRPNDLLTPDHLALPIAPERPVVLYDEDGSEKMTAQIAERLRENGFADVRTLGGGMKAWEAAGGPTQEASTEQPVPPTRPSQVPELDRRS
ncbi:MAG TPA: rhodanese-like domain-containing protein [Candidatus Elarobacter sp.]